MTSTPTRRIPGWPRCECGGHCRWERSTTWAGGLAPGRVCWRARCEVCHRSEPWHPSRARAVGQGRLARREELARIARRRLETERRLQEPEP